MFQKSQSQDEAPHKPQRKPKTGRAERDYERSLKKIGAHVGHLISGYPPGDLAMVPSLTQLLEAYAIALKPWAAHTAHRMLTEVDARDRDSWRSLGNAISAQLRHDIMHAPTGVAMRRLLHGQVDLITSLPTEAAKRVHELTLKGLENSSRAASFVDEIRRSGEVTQSRAVLIARTEVARTASVLTQTRAMAIGSIGYFWETSLDSDVRPSHHAMQGEFVRWDSPPTLDKITAHAGCSPNCRCWCRVALPSDRR